MPGDSTLILFVLLVLAAAAGAWTARRFTPKPKDADSKRATVSPDYFKGVTYLLSEQPDKANAMKAKLLSYLESVNADKPKAKTWKKK